MTSRERRRIEARKARRANLDAQKKFAGEMLRRFMPLQSSLVADAQRIAEKISEWVAAGYEPPAALEAERERIDALLESTRTEMQRWSDAEFEALSPEGAKAAKEGGAAAVKQIELLGTFGRQNPAALENIVARFETVPVSRRYALAGSEAKEAVKQALFEAVAKGSNARTITTQVANALDATRDHADVIARTWINESHRNAGLEYYRATEGRIRGWEWLSAKNTRTCPVCLAMDGTIHPLEEKFGSHPRCRCTTIPILDDEFDEGPTESGAQYFAGLPYAEQVKMVGPTKALLISEGKLALKDLVQEYVDPDYGLSRRHKSFKSMIADGTLSKADFQSAWQRRNDRKVDETPVADPVTIREATRSEKEAVAFIRSQPKVEKKDALTLKDSYWRDEPEGIKETDVKNLVRRTTQQEYELMRWYELTRDRTDLLDATVSRTMKISDLLAPQTAVDKEYVAGLIQKGRSELAIEKGKADWIESPRVYKIDDQYFLIDGNHRVNALASYGDTEVEVSLVDLKALRKLPGWQLSDRLPKDPPGGNPR
jgi:SPP1 gp7 family putative phage head morphogenesis protein